MLTWNKKLQACFAVEETYQMTWPILSRKLLVSTGLRHSFAEIPSSCLALGFAGAWVGLYRSIVQVFSHNLSGEN